MCYEYKSEKDIEPLSKNTGLGRKPEKKVKRESEREEKKKRNREIYKQVKPEKKDRKKETYKQVNIYAMIEKNRVRHREEY